jgi:hypothetical protein
MSNWENQNSQSGQPGWRLLINSFDNSRNQNIGNGLRLLFPAEIRRVSLESSGAAGSGE